MAPAEAKLRAGLVVNPDLNYHFATGRFTSASGKVSISKTINPSFTQYYTSEAGSETSDPATEVLVCDKQTSVVVRPVVTFANASCGKLFV
jgi:hypothetical protein